MELRRTAHDAIVAHARAALPLECCGLLVGTADTVEEAVPARNLKASATRYEVDPEDHFALIRRVRHEGRAIVGAYHSHPSTAAAPSQTDIAEAHDEALVHVIVSLRDQPRVEVRAFRIAAGLAREVPLVLVP